MSADFDRHRWTTILRRIIGAERRSYPPPDILPPRQPTLSQNIFQGARDTTIRGSTFYIYAAPSTGPSTGITEPEPPAIIEEQISSAVDNLVEMARSPSLSGPHRTSADIYGFHLQQKNLGHPLWKPESELRLPEYNRKCGVMLGDVGIITEQRGFSFLFNVCHSRAHLINASVPLPPDFTPFAQSLDSCPTSQFVEHDALHWWYLADSSMARTDNGEDFFKTVLETSANESAALMLPEPMHGSSLSNIIALQVYVKKNLESWYRFVRNTLGWDVNNGDLRVVHSWRKSAGHGIATVSKGGSIPTTELTFLVDNSWSGASGCKYMWRHRGYAQVKAGPVVTAVGATGMPTDERPINQCLFIGTIDCKLQAARWNRIATTSGLAIDPMGLPQRQPSVRSHMRPPVYHTTTERGGPSSASSSHTTQSRESSSNARDSNQDGIILPSDVLSTLLLNAVPTATCAVINTANWGPWLTDSVLDLVESVMEKHVIFQADDALFLVPAGESTDKFVQEYLSIGNSADGPTRPTPSPSPSPEPRTPPPALVPTDEPLEDDDHEVIRGNDPHENYREFQEYRDGYPQWPFRR